jgi:hypothetical protein
MLLHFSDIADFSITAMCERLVGSMPRSNRVPKIEGAMADQSSSATVEQAGMPVLLPGAECPRPAQPKDNAEQRYG